MHSLLKKYPSKALQQGGEKYRKGDNSDLSNILQEKPRKYKTLSPEIQENLKQMKLNILHNLNMSEYMRELKKNRESLISDDHKIMLDNILEIARKNNINDLSENDIIIKDGELYIFGTMFYGDMLDENKRKREYFIEPNNIIKDGHQLSFKSLVNFTSKLYGIEFKRYTDIWDGRFKGNKNESRKYFSNLCRDNEEFFKKMTNVITGIQCEDGLKPKLGCSIPICVDNDNNVFYYDQKYDNSTIACSDMNIRIRIYKPEFI